MSSSTMQASSATSQKPSGSSAASGQQAAPRPYPFPVGVYETQTIDYDQSKTQTTSTQQMPVHTITPTGWIRGVYYWFSMTTSGNTASVAFTADAPFSVINQMTFYDLGQRQVIGPIGGYDWMTLVKFGAYANLADPRADQEYSVTSGSGATGGSFNFCLYLPFEIVARDSLGTLQNESNPGWTVQVTLEASTVIYSTSPTTLGTFRMRGLPVSYTEPEATSPSGRPFAQTPPVPGTMQYWRTENDALAAGSQDYDLVNGIGFPIRNIIWKDVDTSAGTRAAGETDWPDPVTVTYGNVTLFVKPKEQWNSEVGRDFRLTSTTADTANGLENGVFPQYYTKDFFTQPGAELRYKYLQTLVNTVLRIQGSFAATSTLNALTNWVVPSTASYYSLLPGSNS